MKRYFLIFLVLLLPVMIIASDHYNETVTVKDVGKETITFTGSSLMADGTDNYFSQAFLIDDLNFYDSYLVAVTNAETNDDVNVHVQYSFDRETWYDATTASGQVLDDVHDGVLQADTVNVTAGVPDPLYKAAIWARVKLDGQSGNPATTVLTWWWTFRYTQSGTPRKTRIYDRVT
jgi:hypothetical protein